ncbi:MAG: hypothetical protein WC692_11440 [Erythrobacter sp.]|jgi:phytoene synthase
MQHDADPPPPEQDLALAYARPADRALLACVLGFDRALGRAVAMASEPIVGQLRLAWWRDSLGASPADRPRGNPQLDELAMHLDNRLSDLVVLVDGWEALLLADPVDTAVAGAFAAGRERAWQVLAEAFGCPPQSNAVVAAARCWALADLVARRGDGEERAWLVALAKERGPEIASLPRRLRPLAVLAALSRRAIRRGGGPLLSGRISALVALRAGLFGR